MESMSIVIELSINWLMKLMKLIVFGSWKVNGIKLLVSQGYLSCWLFISKKKDTSGNWAICWTPHMKRISSVSFFTDESFWWSSESSYLWHFPMYFDYSSAQTFYKKPIRRASGAAGASSWVLHFLGCRTHQSFDSDVTAASFGIHTPIFGSIAGFDMRIDIICIYNIKYIIYIYTHMYR